MTAYMLQLSGAAGWVLTFSCGGPCLVTNSDNQVLSWDEQACLARLSFPLIAVSQSSALERASTEAQSPS